MQLLLLRPLRFFFFLHFVVVVVRVEMKFALVTWTYMPLASERARKLLSKELSVKYHNSF